MSEVREWAVVADSQPLKKVSALSGMAAIAARFNVQESTLDEGRMPDLPYECKLQVMMVGYDKKSAAVELACVNRSNGCESCDAQHRGKIFIEAEPWEVYLSTYN